MNKRKEDVLPMKILLTTDWFAPAVNGVVTSVLNLRRGLESRGHEVRVLTLSRSSRPRVQGGVYYLRSMGVGALYPYGGYAGRAAAPLSEGRLLERCGDTGSGRLASRQAMSDFMQKAGFWGSALFLMLQAAQVVIPVLPGGASHSASAEGAGGSWSPSGADNGSREDRPISIRCSRTP